MGKKGEKCREKVILSTIISKCYPATNKPEDLAKVGKGAPTALEGVGVPARHLLGGPVAAILTGTGVRVRGALRPVLLVRAAGPRPPQARSLPRSSVCGAGVAGCAIHLSLEAGPLRAGHISPRSWGHGRGRAIPEMARVWAPWVGGDPYTGTSDLQTPHPICPSNTKWCC